MSAAAAMIRWTHRVKFLFLLPGRAVGAGFTVFPLGYSLFLAFHQVDRQVVVTGREKVPVLDADGNPVLKSDGTPRTQTNVIRELQTPSPGAGSPISPAPSATRKCASAVRVTAIFVVAAVTVEIGSAWRSPCCSTASSTAGRSCARS